MKPASPHPRRKAPLLAALGLWLALPSAPAPAGEARALEGPEERGTIEDRSERVRGDTGRWRDEARLQASPPVPRGEGAPSLDDWADSLEEREFELDSGEDTWLIFQTGQLDDNDRVWVESVAREEGRVTVEAVRATWEGNYFRNFTWYGVSALNLGKLPPGDYEVVWVERPRTFRAFADPENRAASWPADDEDAGEPPGEWRLSFTVKP